MQNMPHDPIDNQNLAFRPVFPALQFIDESCDARQGEARSITVCQTLADCPVDLSQVAQFHILTLVPPANGGDCFRAIIVPREVLPAIGFIATGLNSGELSYDLRQP
jgi:hypothetical protein